MIRNILRWVYGGQFTTSPITRAEFIKAQVKVYKHKSN